MAGSAESIFEGPMLQDLDRFHEQSRPCFGMSPDDLARRVVDNRNSLRPCGQALFGNRRCRRRHKSGWLVRARFSGTGHCRSHLLLKLHRMPVSASDAPTPLAREVGASPRATIAWMAT